MSRVLPIIFNTDMVLAILDERKNTTRRIAKGVYPYSEYGGFTTKIKGEWTGLLSSEEIAKLKAPYHIGDILYVRETWCWEPCWDCGMDTDEHNCCDKSAQRIFNHDKGEYGCYIYRASFENNVYPSEGVWHPSIHMPKEAARIWLKVTDVRVEQLQDITIDSIRAEGLTSMAVHAGDMDIAIQEWQILWNSTIKKSDLALYGWDANPWVWVIEFERCEKLEPCIISGIELAEDKRSC